MHSSTKISIVLPVRNGAHRIADQVERLLQGLTAVSAEVVEVVIVDDCSQDGTLEVLDELQSRFPQVGVVRHERPRGLEVAGQTGLQRARGELVFIQETQVPVRIEDLQRLLVISQDSTVVAARAESRTCVLPAELLRHLRAWGASWERQIEPAAFAKKVGGVDLASLQMIRRPHLNRLAGPHAASVRLEGQMTQSTCLQPVVAES